MLYCVTVTTLTLSIPPSPAVPMRLSLPYCPTPFLSSSASAFSSTVPLFHCCSNQLIRRRRPEDAAIPPIHRTQFLAASTPLQAQNDDPSQKCLKPQHPSLLFSGTPLVKTETFRPTPIHQTSRLHLLPSRLSQIYCFRICHRPHSRP